MQVPQLAFQSRPLPPADQPDQAVEAPAEQTREEAAAPASEGAAPQVSEDALPVREQMVQGLVVGGAALVYEDALEPPSSVEEATLQARVAPTDQAAQAPIVEPPPPAVFREFNDVPEATQEPAAPEVPEPAAELGSAPEPPPVEAPTKAAPPDVATLPEEGHAGVGGRRWFLRRRPVAQPEPDRAEEAAVAEEPGLELPEVHEAPEPAAELADVGEAAEPLAELADQPGVAPVWEVAIEEDVPSVVPSEPEPEPQAIGGLAEEAIIEPAEARPEEPPRRRRGLLRKRPVPEASKIEAEEEPQLAFDELADLASPPTVEQAEPEVALPELPVEEQASAPEIQESAQAPEPTRARRWLKRRAPSPQEAQPEEFVPEAPPAPPVTVPPLEQQIAPTPPPPAPPAPAPAAPVQRARPPAPQVPRPPVAPEAPAAQLPPRERPAPAAARPAAEAPSAPQPQAPAPPPDVPARPAAAAAPAPAAAPEAELQAASPWTDQPYYVEATPGRAPEPPPPLEPMPEGRPSIRGRFRRRRPAPDSQTSAPSIPAEPMATHEPAPTVSAPPAPAPLTPPAPQARPVPFEALAPPPTAPPPAAPVVPPSPPAPAASLPTTSTWKSSMPEPPPATGHSVGVQSGPAPVTMEITCPRCGEPSPRGLCEACEYALLELRELMIGLGQE